MMKIESSVKQVSASQEEVYTRLADLNGLERVRDHIPQDKLRIEAFDRDSVTLQVPAVGQVTLAITEREPFKCIKMQSTESPIPFNLWAQMEPTSPAESKLRLTLGVDINPVMAAFVRHPLEEGLEQMAETLARIFQ